MKDLPPIDIENLWQVGLLILASSYGGLIIDPHDHSLNLQFLSAS